MGVAKSLSDLYRLALDKVNSETGEFNTASEAGYLPENKTIDILKLFIATSMELYRFPFAIVRVPLINKVIDNALTFRDGEKTHSIFQRPNNVANRIGIFKEKALPDIQAVLTDYSTVNNLSIPFSYLGADRIFIPNGEYIQKEGELLWFVYVRSDPAPSDMTGLFQNYLINELAAHIYLGSLGKNSNIYRALLLGAEVYFQRAKANISENTSDYSKLLPNFLEIAYYADKDGVIRGDD